MPLTDPAVVQAALDLEEAQHALCEAALTYVGSNQDGISLRRLSDSAHRYAKAKTNYTSVSDAT